MQSDHCSQHSRQSTFCYAQMLLHFANTVNGKVGTQLALWRASNRPDDSANVDGDTGSDVCVCAQVLCSEISADCKDYGNCVFDDGFAGIAVELYTAALRLGHPHGHVVRTTGGRGRYRHGRRGHVHRSGCKAGGGTWDECTRRAERCVRGLSLWRGAADAWLGQINGLMMIVMIRQQRTVSLKYNAT